MLLRVATLIALCEQHGIDFSLEDRSRYGGRLKYRWLLTLRPRGDWHSRSMRSLLCYGVTVEAAALIAAARIRRYGLLLVELSEHDSP